MRGFRGIKRLTPIYVPMKKIIQKEKEKAVVPNNPITVVESKIVSKIPKMKESLQEKCLKKKRTSKLRISSY